MKKIILKTLADIKPKKPENTECACKGEKIGLDPSGSRWGGWLKIYCEDSECYARESYVRVKSNGDRPQFGPETIVCPICGKATSRFVGFSLGPDLIPWWSAKP